MKYEMEKERGKKHLTTWKVLFFPLMSKFLLNTSLKRKISSVLVHTTPLT